MRRALAAFRESSWGLRASLALALGAFAYTVARSALLSLTHDEALTFILHASAPYGEVLAHSRNISSNNHLLNTLFIKLCMGLFGSSELVLRIPALLGHALYLSVIVRLLSRSLSGARLTGATALLALNPMLIDFFSCARGYGLGIGLATLGLERLLWRWSRDLDQVSRWNGVQAVAPLAAAVLANVAFANIFAAALATVLLFDFVLRAKRQPLPRAALATARELLLPALVASAGLALVYNPAVLERIRTFVSAWGGTRGFWADTVASLVACVLYDRPYAAATTLALSIAIALLFLGSAGLALHALRRNGTREPLALPIAGLASILVLVACSMKLQFALAGTLYALDRSAIYLLPPFLILVVVSWQMLGEQPAGRVRLLARGAHGLFIGTMVLHGLLCVNTTHNHVWRYDATTKEAVHAVRDRIGSRRMTRPFKLGVNWLFEPAVHYYLRTEELEWIGYPEEGGPDDWNEFYYLRDEDRALLEKYRLEVIADYPLSGGVLATSL